MSFLTCFCDLPQNEHLTRSLDSPNLATIPPPPPGSLRYARSLRDERQFSCSDHLVDDAVILGLIGAHDEVPVGIPGDLLHCLPGVRGQHLVEQVAHAEDFL